MAACSENPRPWLQRASAAATSAVKAPWRTANRSTRLRIRRCKVQSGAASKPGLDRAQHAASHTAEQDRVTVQEVAQPPGGGTAAHARAASQTRTALIGRTVACVRAAQFSPHRVARPADTDPALAGLPPTLDPKLIPASYLHDVATHVAQDRFGIEPPWRRSLRPLVSPRPERRHAGNERRSRRAALHRSSLALEDRHCPNPPRPSTAEKRRRRQSSWSLSASWLRARCLSFSISPSRCSAALNMPLASVLERPRACASCRALSSDASNCRSVASPTRLAGPWLAMHTCPPSRTASSPSTSNRARSTAPRSPGARTPARRALRTAATHRPAAFPTRCRNGLPDTGAPQTRACSSHAVPVATVRCVSPDAPPCPNPPACATAVVAKQSAASCFAMSRLGHALQ